MKCAWLLLAAALVAGCSSTTSGSGSAASPPGSSSAAGVNACTLLSEAEVAAIVPGAGLQEGETGGKQCTWENTDNYNSVTVTIGEPGTARGGLPESPYSDSTPGPDGIRFGMGNTIGEFAVAERACEVQIVITGTDTRPVIASTIAKVRARVKG